MKKREACKNNCEGCFCETFKGRTGVRLGALQIRSTVLTLGLQVPPTPTGTRRITSITLLCLDGCCATFSIGYNEEPLNELLFADCKDIYSFSFAPTFSPFPPGV